MKLYSAFLLIMVLMVSISSAAMIEGVAGLDYRTDQFVISVQKGITLAPFEAGNQSFTTTGFSGLDQIITRENVTAIEEFYPAPVKNDILRDVVKRLYVVTVGKGGDLGAAITAFGGDSRIESAEPYRIHHITYVPNDPMIGSWYQLASIEAYQAWDFIRGDSTSRPILGIVDSGVYYDHPDLAPNMWINSGEDLNGDGQFTSADINGVDDDANGYVDDVVGYDIAMNDNIPFEPTPTHGTHVAGCASMASDNGIGGAAVSWGARIMAVKVARDNAPENIYNGFAGISYAMENGATVINLSWGSAYYSLYEQNIINAAYQSGVVIVAAAGNDGSSSVFYPAGYNHVISVAAVDANDQKPDWSNYGSWITISAPGVSIHSTWDHDSYASLDGTSMASPVAAGVVCLIRAANPGFTVDQVKARLTATADDIDSLNPGYEGLMGAGRVNASAAVGRYLFPRLRLVSDSVAITEDDGDGRLNPLERFNWVMRLSNLWTDAQNVVGTLRSADGFTILDSVANFGNIPGSDGNGNNFSNPFDIRVNSDASIGEHDFTLHVTSGALYQADFTVRVSVTLEQIGFPGNIPGEIDSPPLVVDFDGDGQKEILVGANDGNYYSFETNGSITPGWPRPVSGLVPGGASVGDLEHNGTLDVVGMSNSGNVYAWHADGTSLTGFPRNCGTLMYGTPALGDINGDSSLEIVVGVFTSRSIYVLKSDGTNFGNWPFQGAGLIQGSVALADLDNDGLPEIVYGDIDSTVHVLNADKSEVAGFPKKIGGPIRITPCVADIDGDGHLNIIIGTSNGLLYALDYNGNIMPGWPFQAGSAFASSPSLCDIDNDGHLEVIIGCNNSNLYAFRANGQAQGGFPVHVGGVISASPVEGDIDGNGFPDIVFGAYDGKIYAIDHLGQIMRNFPIAANRSGPITTAAALSDFDGDNHCEIVAGVKAADNNLEVIDYRAPLLPNEVFPWPFFGKEARRTSYYGAFETGIGNEAGIPTTFELSQNYPNPFNASTNIRFSIPSGQIVKLSVFDLLGRHIRTLAGNYFQAGSHEIIWDGASDLGKTVSSGAYFYRLEANNTSLTKSMTLLK
jgi:hypothetical protein